MAEMIYQAQKTSHRPKTRQFVGGLKYDLICTGLLTWLVVGAYCDAFAHTHNAVDNFFTPWHGVLYSGGLAVLSFLAVTLIGNRLKGYTWRQAVPQGYEYTALGLIAFPLGGIGDMLWHVFFGIELDIEGVLSPTHLALMVVVFLMLSGPLRASWMRATSRQISWTAALPIVLTFTFILLLVGTITNMFHPFAAIDSPDLVAAANERVVASFLIQSAILVGLLLSILRRWQLPFGSLTLILGLNEVLLLMVTPHADSGWNILLPVGLLSGLAGDLYLWKFHPTLSQTRLWRIFAFGLPTILYGLYFAAPFLTEPIYWRIHVWAGLIFACGMVGLLISLLVFPPRLPTEAQ